MIYQRFTYTDDAAAPVDFTLTIPGRPWEIASAGVGGREFSASRVPSSFEIRRDDLFRQTLRFWESEWAAVLKMLEHGQRGTQVTVYPDSSGASRTAYLFAPDYGERIQYRRTEVPGVLEIDVEWVDASGSGWDAFEFEEE